MPNLLQSLQMHDLGHLRIVAGLWGVELASAETEPALKELTTALLDAPLAAEVLEALPAQARAALAELVESGGRMPWAAFARRHGEIRPAGPGRRDREQPYQHPISTAEILFYRAFLARAFFDTPSGLQEFAYTPEDLLKIIQQEEFTGCGGAEEKTAPPAAVSETVKIGQPLGRSATPAERARPFPPSDHLLDDAATFLAALRMGIEAPEMQVPAAITDEFLKAAGIVTDGAAQPEQVRTFLEMPRLPALALLHQSWQESSTFNELRLVPGLICEGEWSNRPLETRTFILRILEDVPKGKWWSLPAFIQDIKGKYPDFQRPAGEYDSWFIKRASDGVYLRGFENWDEVDGALIHFFLTGPLNWLGMVDLAQPETSAEISSFRVNEKTTATSENGKLSISSGGRISVPRRVPRSVRYLLARFCEWDEALPDEYRYHVTTGSLKKAGEQGLKVGSLLSLLARNAAAEIPPAFVKALKRWERNGTEARLEVRQILRVTRPEVLEELRRSKAGRFLGESLGPVTSIVKAGAQAKVLAALAELGLLAEQEYK